MVIHPKKVRRDMHAILFSIKLLYCSKELQLTHSQVLNLPRINARNLSCSLLRWASIVAPGRGRSVLRNRAVTRGNFSFAREKMPTISRRIQAPVHQMILVVLLLVPGNFDPPGARQVEPEAVHKSHEGKKPSRTPKSDRSFLKSAPTLNIWEFQASESQGHEGSAIEYVERAIEQKASLPFSSQLSMSQALAVLKAKLFNSGEVSTHLFSRHDERLVIGKIEIAPIDAAVLLDACGAERIVRIGGINFYVMSNVRSPGFAAIRPFIDGRVVIIRATLPLGEVQELVTTNRIANILG